MESTDYQRGYAAGRRRVERDERRRATVAAQDEFWLQSFLALMPVLLDSRNLWEQDGKPLTTVADRVSLASDAADAALAKAKRHLS